MPKISIITINFNNAKGLKQTMDSVFAQTFTDYEYIIVDGGSNDESGKLIEEYKDRFAYSVSEKDGGVYFAMNKGIAKAKGNYLMFLNSGDYLWDSNVLSHAISLTKRKKADIYYGNIVVEPNKGNFIIKKQTDKISIGMLQNQTINHQASLIKSDLFGLLGLYDTRYSLAADHAFYLKAYLNDKVFTFMDYEMVCYELNGLSTLHGAEYYSQMKLIFLQLNSEINKKVRKEYIGNKNLIEKSILITFDAIKRRYHFIKKLFRE